MALKKGDVISIRRSQKIAPLLSLAEEIGRDEGAFLIECAREIARMINTGSNEVPKIVQAARALREKGISFASEEDTAPFQVASNVVRFSPEPVEAW